jgi:hypothetical protein
VFPDAKVCWHRCCCLLLSLQILWSYGRRGNDDFFAYHGFVLTDNPDEDVVLFDDVEQLLYWAAQHVPQLAALRGQEQQLMAVAGGSGSCHALDKAVASWSCHACFGKRLRSILFSTTQPTCHGKI